MILSDHENLAHLIIKQQMLCQTNMTVVEGGWSDNEMLLLLFLSQNGSTMKGYCDCPIELF